MAEDSMNDICWDYFEKLSETFYNDLELRQSYSVEETNTLSPKSEQLSNILEQLSLSQHFPANLTINTVLSFRDNMFEKPKVASDIPWFILRNIMSINFNFRDKILEDCILSVCPEPSHDNVLEEGDEGRDTDPQRLHDMYPPDVLLAIFLCCDPFLKMVIAQKMFMCQLAIPIIFKDFLGSELTFSLWPVREIVSSTGESVAEHAMKSVSFIRLGDGSLQSKSKLINELLRSQSQEHSTFFHSDCPLGSNPRTISNGLVEITWYMPSSLSDTDTDTDTIKVPFTIFNLRGNAIDYDKQRDVLIRNSTVSVLLIKYDDWETESSIRVLSAIHKSEAIVILVTNLPPNENLKTFLKRYEEKTAMDTSKTKKTTVLSTYNSTKQRNLNASELKRELTRHVSSALEKSDRNIRLAEISRHLPEGISCDEENKKCTHAKKLSDDFGAGELKLSSEDSSTRKNAFLPLQGEHWQNWSGKLRKQQSSSGQKESYDVGETLLTTMKNERKKQVEQCNRSPPVFAEFIKALLSIDNGDTTLLYFLSWLRQHMDTESRTVVPNLQKELHDAIEKHEQQKSDETQLIVDLADKKLVQASFGIEHFFREIGQVYEAFIYTKKDTGCTIKPNTLIILEQLPKVVAKLLVLGQPLEIMDGDAACVPITWIKAVFNELEKYLHKKLFVISVLGVQSSGKSTLLNAMFGLQFVVSAGRCTRGMNIQLVHVDRTKSSLQFDYAMVIDTEGLRAPELFGEIHRDNEFATLVVGLSDVIIINIKGEAIADMKDILQIVVYGILSLKQANHKLNLQQLCVLVHENVSAPNAARQMLQGSKSTVQYLDKMTKEAASHLHIGHITSFKQVIGFNPLLHVKHIPDLWYGSPPMAPASPTYSEKVTELTRCVLNELAMSKKTAFMISETCLQLEALWKGILTEDFVFRFSNCLEVKAYSSLESVYQQLVWRLEKFKLEWSNNNIRPMLSKCETCPALYNSEIDLMTEFTKDLCDLAHTVDTELTYFFDNSELRDHMSHWKESKLSSIDSVVTCIKDDVINKITHEKEQCMYQLRINAERSVKEKQINEKATTLADYLKGMKATKEELKEKFDELWNDWFAEIAPLIDGTQLQRLKHELKFALIYKFSMRNHLVVKELDVTDIDSGFGANILKDSIPASEITKEHINLKIKCETEEELLHAFQKEESHCKQQTLDVVNGIFFQIDTYFADLFMQDTEYEKTQFSQVLNFITDAFDTHNDLNSLNKFTMTPVLQIKVAVHAARYSFEKFKTLNQKYQDLHSLRALLEAYKSDALQLFTDIVEAKTEEIIAANTLCRDLTALIQERIEREIPIKIQTKMREIYNYHKYHLIIAVLKDLAERGEFSDYKRYLDNPGTFVLEWITKETIRTVFKEDTPPLYMKWVKEALQTLICDIKEDATHVTRTECPSDIKYWVTSFRQRLENKKLLLSSVTFQHVTNHHVSDFDSFLQRVNEQLSNVSADLHSHFDRLSSGEITWKYETPYRLLFDFLWGCTALCPWCNEPCQRADRYHVNVKNDCHTCIQHRPVGLGGVQYTDTDKLTVESCNFAVQSTKRIRCNGWCNCAKTRSGESMKNVYHPYKKYKTYVPAWDIVPSSDMSSSKYWTWFMVKYNDQLAEHYHAKPADIPHSWKMVSQEDALRSLREYVL